LDKRDKRFYDSFMIVTGIFTGIILGIVFAKALAQPTDIIAITSKINSNTQIEFTEQNRIINSFDTTIIRTY
jgi:tRNA A37 threonylcarbamoyladenosine modification protein TsaB|tara:strand:- start:174 stop:389 length:216 start_codon:yes stop_codon:yes gene_type:complete